MFGLNDDDPVVKIKRVAALPALSAEFDKFLYATIGDTNGELPFSVLSALARQDLDPWAEAEKLAQLSEEFAVARLASTLAQAGTRSKPAENTETAARLIALLPRTHRFAIPPFDKLAIRDPRHMAPIIIYFLVGALLLASVLLSQ